MKRLSIGLLSMATLIFLEGCLLVPTSKYNQLMDEKLSSDHEVEELKARLSAEHERSDSLREWADLLEQDVMLKLNQIDNLKGDVYSLEELVEQQKQSLTDLKDQAARLEEGLKEEIERGEIRLQQFRNKLIINVDDRVLFPSGQAMLKTTVQPTLRKIGDILNRYQEQEISIEGHTDNVPINTPKFPSNWELSAARALEVLNFFAEELEVDPNRLRAVGYGQFHPVASNETPEGRALNRRVDIVIVPK